MKLGMSHFIRYQNSFKLILNLILLKGVLAREESDSSYMGTFWCGTVALIKEYE